MRKRIAAPIFRLIYSSFPGLNDKQDSSPFMSTCQFRYAKIFSGAAEGTIGRPCRLDAAFDAALAAATPEEGAAMIEEAQTKVLAVMNDTNE